MRIPRAFAACLAAVAAAGLLAGAAQAQSIIQKIFGFGSSAAPPPPFARSQPQTIPASRFYGRTVRQPFQSQPARDHEADEDIGPPDSGGPYRTLCVRTCDGFYFPLRHNAVHSNFASDVKSCRAACGSEARLFYYAVNGGSTDTMIDLADRSYAELPHALAYRKALVQGCACKPVPWAPEEAARHQGYAAIEAAELEKDKAFLEARAAQTPKDLPTQTDGPNVAAVASTQDSGAAAAEPSTGTTGTPPSAVLERPDLRKRIARPSRGLVQRAHVKVTSGASFFGGFKSKYVWPGDAR